MNPFSLDDDDNENGLNEERSSLSFKDATVFLIDSSVSMHNKVDGQEMSPFQISLQFVSRMMRRKVVAQARDKIGVIFFNCFGVSKSANDNNNNGVNLSNPSNQLTSSIRVYKSLDQPFAARVQ